jgi:hypothetical protein
MTRVPDRLVERSSTPDGALFLAERLRDFWRDRGHAVDVWVECVFVPGGHAVFVVRSTLVNGLPSADSVQRAA